MSLLSRRCEYYGKRAIAKWTHGPSWIIRCQDESCPSKALIQRPSWKICICSMLTVTVLLLYRKVTPLKFLPWCDNLITFGSCLILVFLSFSKVKKGELYVHFEFQVSSLGPNCLKFGEHIVITFADKTMSAILIIFLIKMLCLFFAGSSAFFPFSKNPLVKKITHACAKNLRHGF